MSRLSLPWFLLCGAFAGWLVAGIAPDGLVAQLDEELLAQPWRLQRPPEDPVEVTEDRWFFLPHLFGDFDMQMEVELGEGVELDVLLRQVEPRRLGAETLPFAARWSALRLSTDGDGVGWRTRDEALFGPPGDGVGVAPGYVSTVWVEARGRTLHANVAGKKQPPIEADDRYGMFTMIARGGNAVVRRLEFQPLPLALWWWSRWTWAALGVLAAGLSFAVAAASRRGHNAWAGGVLLVALAALDGWWTEVPRLALPEPATLAFSLASAVVAANLLVWRLRGVHALLVGVAAVALWLPVGLAGSPDDRQVDEVFGADAGNQITEAHGQYVRGPLGLHDVTSDGPRVLLLGGEVLYGISDVSADLEILVTSELGRRLNRKVDVPCPRTAFADVGQQWRMFRGFYAGLRPQVVVLGVDTVDEADSLRDVVAEARAWCEQAGVRLVLFATTALGDAHLDVLRRLGAEGVPLVVADAGGPRSVMATQLADAIEPWIKP